MRIVLPEHFRHAGDLRPHEAGSDPRDTAFPDEEVIVDARETNFLRPAAIMWGLVDPMLARNLGRTCRFLVPENQGVCIYAQSLGVFDMLQHNDIAVDDRGVREQHDPQIVLPLTRFSTEAEVENLANLAFERLTASGLGAANVHPFVSEVFAELALNAVQHSQSLVGGFGFIQFYGFEEGERFICAVADGGIGIRESLTKNPDLRDRIFYDWDAIELAVRERVSGTGTETRGIGLYGVAEDMRSPRHQLIIHSGIGMLHIGEDVDSHAARTSLFPGTLAYASIPT